MGLAWRLNHEVMHVLTAAMPLKHVRSRAERPMASITFDDFPKSAWTVGGPILAEFGARATYYVSGRFCGAVEKGVRYWDEDDLTALDRAGHEIASHSFAHARASTLDPAAFAADAERNARFIAERLPGASLSSYAYPEGDISPRAKALASRRYACARGVMPGVNAGWIDLAKLKAIPVEHRNWRPEAIDGAIARALASRGWLVFFTHDVDPSPTPYGATPDMLRHLLGRLADEGVEILPVKQAMARAVFGG